jgi:hypothetical protein
MTRPQPPSFASFLLARLGPQNEALAGDLAEEYRAGRSRFWYFRQVAVAIVLHVVADIRGHWPIVLRGVVTGLVLLRVLGWVVAWIEGAYLNPWLLHNALGFFWMQHNVYFYTHMALWFPASVVVGWVVARLHARQRASAVLCLVLAIAGFAIANERLFFLIRNSLTHERFVPYLVLYLLTPAAGMMGIAVGGLSQRSHEHAR